MAAPIILPILSIFKSAGLNQARQALLGASKDFGSLAGTIGQAAGAFAAFNSLTTAREFLIQSVNATQQFERNLLALQQVFEGAAPQLRAFTKEVESYGLSQAQAAQASVFLGSVLKQYGFTVAQSAEQTERLVTLAQDLATTYGYDVQEALLAITALFRGEYDPIEKFGVAMKQSEVNARLAADGLDDLEGAQLANAQATARLTMLFERAGDSVGAFGRASDTLYASQQRLGAIVGNLQVAFGSPLQQPLAEINNLFADLAQEFGPDLIEVADAITSGIETLTPTLALVGRTVLELISPFQQLIEILNFVISVIRVGLDPALVLINGSLGVLNGLLDVGSTLLGNFAIALGLVNNESDSFKELLENLGIDQDKENSLESYIRRLNSLALWIARFRGTATVFSTDMHLMELGMVASATEATNLANKTNALDIALRKAARGTVDAEGKLRGLAGVFADIDDAIAQSKAEQSMQDLGLSAAFIEEVLTRPNWQAIFETISTYAKLAAIDISKVMSVTAAAGLSNQKAELEKTLNELFAASDPKNSSKKAADNAEKVAKDYVKAFTNGIRDEAEKQSARTQLAQLGASAGLIERILNTDGWKKVWLSIKNGTYSVKELQAAFNATADGAKELKDAATEAAEAADKRIQAALKLFEEQQEIIGRQVDAIKEFEKTLKEVSVLDILPNPTELGRYEQSIVEQFGNVRDSIREAFNNKAILEDAYNNLIDYADKEQALLQANARQRDEILRRYDLAKGLIASYQDAFKGAANLNTMLQSLETKAKKVTVTQFTEGLVKMRDGLKEFKVTLSREYEEEIKETVNKSQGLVTKFQEIAAKARAFADNLRKLKDMNLNGDLFNQLVQAGVEAGGETAQALVDGGADTITEINALFKEIDSLGADLGEEVARGLYGQGVDMGTGLLDGLWSMAEDFAQTGYDLALKFTTAFNNQVTEAIGKAILALHAANAPVGGPEISTGYDATGMPQVIISPDIPIQMPSSIVVQRPEGDLVMNPFTPVPGGSPFANTTININVRTDATQSNAMVGKQIGSIITSYVETGGLVAI